MNTPALPAAPAAPKDFDFILGHWRVRHRRLNRRLAGCTEWSAFDGRTVTRAILGGHGNIEDNLLHMPDGDVRAVALRAFDAATGLWCIWWLSGRTPHQLDVPVVGRFTGTRGEFLAQDRFEGRPIRVRFIWNATPGLAPTWEQAFSDDDGASWETNWVMTFERDEG